MHGKQILVILTLYTFSIKYHYVFKSLVGIDFNLRVSQGISVVVQFTFILD